MKRRPPRSTRTDTPFPDTTLFRTRVQQADAALVDQLVLPDDRVRHRLPGLVWRAWRDRWPPRLDLARRARAGEGGRRRPARGNLRAQPGGADRPDREGPGHDQAGPVDTQQTPSDPPWFARPGGDR